MGCMHADLKVINVMSSIERTVLSMGNHHAMASHVRPALYVWSQSACVFDDHRYSDRSCVKISRT